MAGIALIVYHWPQRRNCGIEKPAKKPAALADHTTAMLWVICPMAILTVMHALVLWVAVAGINFQ